MLNIKEDTPGHRILMKESKIEGNIDFDWKSAVDKEAEENKAKERCSQCCPKKKVLEMPNAPDQQIEHIEHVLRSNDIDDERRVALERMHHELKIQQAAEADPAMKCIRVYGDGHCAYRAVAIAQNTHLATLERNEVGVIKDKNQHDIETRSALTLRSEVAKLMKANWERFSTIDEHDRSARVDGILSSAWAGEEEILALSLLLDRPIVVHAVSNGTTRIIRYNEGTSTTPIHLQYTRDEEPARTSGDAEALAHYDLLVEHTVQSSSTHAVGTDEKSTDE